MVVKLVANLLLHYFYSTHQDHQRFLQLLQTHVGPLYMNICIYVLIYMYTVQCCRACIVHVGSCFEVWSQSEGKPKSLPSFQACLYTSA